MKKHKFNLGDRVTFSYAWQKVGRLDPEDDRVDCLADGRLCQPWYEEREIGHTRGVICGIKKITFSAFLEPIKDDDGHVWTYDFKPHMRGQIYLVARDMSHTAKVGGNRLKIINEGQG